MADRGLGRWAMVLAAAGSLAACGGSDPAPVAAPTPPPTTPAPTPTPTPPAPAPTPSPAPAPAPAPPPVAANDKLCGTVLSGQYAGQEGCAEAGSFHYSSTARSVMCLGAGCPLPFTSQVRIDTRPNYLGPLTVRVVNCRRAPVAGLDNDTNCPAPSTNDVNHRGMIGASFDAPNGAVGPQTSITIQQFTASFGMPCINASLPSPYSDANHVLVQDAAGNRLYLPVTVGQSCIPPP